MQYLNKQWLVHNSTFTNSEFYNITLNFLQVTNAFAVPNVDIALIKVKEEFKHGSYLNLPAKDSTLPGIVHFHFMLFYNKS